MAELPARRRLRERQERERAAQAASADGTATAVAAPRVDTDAGEGAGGRGEVAYSDAGPGEWEDGAASAGGESGATAAERNQEAWKTFGTGTEAGRLLKKLYGDNSRPTIKYPKVRTQHRPHGQAFIPAGGKHDVDARKPKPKPTGRVHVPKPTGGMQRRHLTAIEYSEMMGGRRKRGTDIRAELKEREAERDRYRPMPSKAKSTPLEKQRLQNINTFKGGKGLPSELTLAPIEGHIPLNMMIEPHKARARMKAKVQREAAARSTSRESGGGGGGGGKTAEQEAAAELFDQIAAEIEERAEFLRRMTELGQGKKHEAAIKGEIAQRTKELERLHALMS